MTSLPPALFRRWVHVREEDAAGVRVYRPADRPLPPARGREGIEFRDDGTFADLRPGPTDAPVASVGHWTAPSRTRLNLAYPPGARSTGAPTGYEIVELTPDLLRLRPV
ncbi:hypothetical protein DFJ67_4588 [Asanoa ferruginea]|uniref:Uncharacterized protein n=1 Tax=Asanoa ferruginea TaxID=53367 RepID=A0A3D9ZXN2_9ACTN|nr:hypothetical protein [Asanoa ferruginea]REF98570.1 hypothetical protein DFJ67_4588 [Asanoa ferruginea]GIF53505.1 hypothetical protein Afe04nite_80440 [Asanoa ferruginea]